MLASLKDLAMMPLGKSFYEMVKTALNLTAASVQDRRLEGKEFASDFFLKYLVSMLGICDSSNCLSFC